MAQDSQLSDNINPDIAMRGCNPTDIEDYDPETSKDNPFYWASLIEKRGSFSSAMKNVNLQQTDSLSSGRKIASRDATNIKSVRSEFNESENDNQMLKDAWVQRVWRYLAHCFDGGLVLGFVSKYIKQLLCVKLTMHDHAQLI